MKVIITQYGTTIITCQNLTILPRIGETMLILRDYYKVKDVVWHMENPMYVEIKIM